MDLGVAVERECRYSRAREKALSKEPLSRASTVTRAELMKMISPLYIELWERNPGHHLLNLMEAEGGRLRVSQDPFFRSQFDERFDMHGTEHRNGKLYGLRLYGLALQKALDRPVQGYQH